MNHRHELSRRDTFEAIKSVLIVLALAAATGYASVHALLA